MKKLIIFSFFIILNTIAMKPNFNIEHTIKLSTYKNINNSLLKEFNLKMTEAFLDFEAHRTTITSKNLYLEDMFRNSEFHNSKICEILAAFPNSNFINSIVTLENKFNALYSEWTSCTSKIASFSSLFLSNKKIFEKNFKVVQILLTQKHNFSSIQDSKLVKSLEFLPRKNREIVENFYKIITNINSIEEQLITYNKNIIQLRYGVENKYSQFVSKQNQRYQENLYIATNQQNQPPQENDINEFEQKN